MTLPRSLSYLEDASLTCLGGIKEIIFPASIIYLGNRIDTLSIATKVIFERGSRLETIGEYFLLNSRQLKEITIPSSVVSIGKHFLTNCTKLEQIMFCGKTDFSGLAESFEKCNNLKSTIVSKEYNGTQFAGKSIEIKDFNECFPVFRFPTIEIQFNLRLKIFVYIFISFFSR